MQIDSEIMIPVSVINQMRREAADLLAGRLRAAAAVTRAPLAEERIGEIAGKERLGNGHALHQLEQAEAGCRYRLVPVQDFRASEDNALPYILNVSRGELDAYIEENFDSIVSAVCDTGILIGNLGWIKQFADAGVQVYGDYGLNAYNSQCVKAYEELGVKMLFPSHEMCCDGKTSDPRFGGRVPLMITEHPFGTDCLIDRKGVKHEIKKLTDKSVIL